MLEFIVIFFGLIIGFSLYTRRFRNPYKLIYIFGKKGSGKSTLMVKEMVRHINRGWVVYTDMPDCLVPGVRKIKALDLSTFVPLPHSVLFLEEVGITFDNRKFKSFDDGLRDFIKFQRKYKVKCYMNSQSYDVDKKIRDCVDSMVLMSSVADCIAICRPIRKSVTLTEPSAEAESRIAEKLMFTPLWKWSFMWMPKYHKYFDSFSAPPRELISYEQICAEYFELRNRQIPAKLQKEFSRYENRSNSDVS